MLSESSLTRLRGLVLGGLALAQPASAQRVRGRGDVQPAYDYIVVGGGTSGLTVADRLTEDGKTTVLVIENGPLVNSPVIDDVGGGLLAVGGPYLYNITSATQENLLNRAFRVRAGNVLGGSSAVNAMMVVRGTTEDYDRWGGFFGDQSEWTWAGLLPYFKKALTFTPPDPAVAESVNMTVDSSYWGDTSGVKVGFPSYQYPAVVPFVEAFREIPGVEFQPDSGAGRAGVHWYPTFMDPKLVKRSYARTGHYDGIERDNYEVVTDSKVIRVTLDELRATGVVFKSTASNATERITVRANKEVILAAGALHTPQLLQLSGIGPQKLLDAAGIDTVVDLPGVGQNFQDHPILPPVFNLQNFTVHPNLMDLTQPNSTFAEWAKDVWAANRTGPYSMGIGNVAAWLGLPVIAPEKYKDIASSLDAQDPAAYLPADTHPTVIAGYRAQMEALSRGLRSVNTAIYGLPIFSTPVPTTSTLLLHPLSRGTVGLDPTAAAPEDAEPRVDYRTLSNPVDEAVLVEFVRFARRYFGDTSLARYGPVEVGPSAGVTTDAGLAAFVRAALAPSQHHPVGTAAMLPRELGGVVDERLRVYGVAGLRVVDASIMPTLPGANTCQTVYAVAEKAADLIRSDL